LRFRGGSPGRRPSPLELLATPPERRGADLATSLLARIVEAHGAEESLAAGTARGLALHARAQRPSSPFETPAQATEIDEEALRAWTRALASSEGPLDPFSRLLWRDLALLLTEKRMPDRVLAYVEPVAAAFAPWPELERAVGLAYLELLQPEEALEHLERALAGPATDVLTILAAASAATDLGEHRRATRHLDRGLELFPGRRELRRELGFALERQGDPRGRELLQALLREDPEDDGIRRQLASGAPAAERIGLPEDPR